MDCEREGAEIYERYEDTQFYRGLTYRDLDMPSELKHLEGFFEASRHDYSSTPLKTIRSRRDITNSKPAIALSPFRATFRPQHAGTGPLPYSRHATSLVVRSSPLPLCSLQAIFDNRPSFHSHSSILSPQVRSLLLRLLAVTYSPFHARPAYTGAMRFAPGSPPSQYARGVLHAHASASTQYALGLALLLSAPISPCAVRSCNAICYGPSSLVVHFAPSPLQYRPPATKSNIIGPPHPSSESDLDVELSESDDPLSQGSDGASRLNRTLV
ncbi:hypothetical protein SCHPADRAFT_946600 [Schizopora paradoxa]|uniref:Uncharacterized protein n=1 Tax=Schizopora paradoxa TaxID=27342 RepID=A0A0H2R211_9AGAM|nr:hypothetical protein SCHPADRAFT_946600 [Schizopora paradoxa]